MHVHVADCYGFWLGQFSIQGGQGLGEFEKPQTVFGMRALFKKVDACVETFFQAFDEKWDLQVAGYVSWQADPFVVTPLWLYTHALTHEFHHNGQLVSMSRALGRVYSCRYGPHRANEQWVKFNGLIK